MTRAAAAVFLLLATAVADMALAATGAALHTELAASRPTEGDTLAAPPSELWLLFTEPVEAAATEIAILGAAAMRIPLAVRADTSNVKALLATVPGGALGPGAWRVAWRVVSADGHPIEGSFVFHVAGAPADAPPAPPPPEPPKPRATWPLGVLRGLAVSALLAFTGRLAVGAWVVPGAAGPPGRALAATATALLLVHALAWAAYASPSGAVDREAIVTALRTLPGRLEAVRLALMALAVWALLLARRAGLAAVFAVAAVVVGAGIGHSAARAAIASVPAKAVHLVAAALWLGGLLHLAGGIRAGVAPVVDARKVSAAALVAVLVIAASGVLQTVLLLGSPAELVRSRYGALVLAKAAGLAVLVAFGAHNRFRLIPALDRGGSVQPLTRSVRWELVVMAAVLLVAGLLSYTPTPAE